uniref:Uncharacterized protein n=1 Tax=Spongospora subterranea TaxID=70186 RepID=A0A0H5QZ73_9EUKA|eukprot:CRZ07001.1 hypothetical protein [Spongospora subterranea]
MDFDWGDAAVILKTNNWPLNPNPDPWAFRRTQHFICKTAKTGSCHGCCKKSASFESAFANSKPVPATVVLTETPTTAVTVLAQNAIAPALCKTAASEVAINSPHQTTQSPVIPNSTSHCKDLQNDQVRRF